MTDQGFELERVDLETGGGELALIRLNRPEKRNPLDWATMRALGRTLAELEEVDEVRVVAITGTGPAFSAGGDMEKYRKLQADPVDFPRFLQDFHDVVRQIAWSAKPHVALVNGVAVAGGLELILACDLAIAAASARIGDAHQPFGQMGGGGVLTLLTPQVGIHRAKELLFTGRLLDATEAAEVGLVSAVVADDDLLEAGLEFARSVAVKSPLAIANAKRVVNQNFWAAAGVESGLLLEREMTARYCLTSQDATHGLEAFAAKRRPDFVGA